MRKISWHVTSRHNTSGKNSRSAFAQYKLLGILDVFSVSSSRNVCRSHK